MHSTVDSAVHGTLHSIVVHITVHSNVHSAVHSTQQTHLRKSAGITEQLRRSTSTKLIN